MVDRQLTLPGEIVKKSNALARAKWSPKSVWEPRMVALVASMVRKDDDDFCVYRVPVSEVVRDKVDGRTYARVAAAVENIMGRVITINDPKGWTKYTVFSKCRYVEGEGVLELGFHPDLKPHFLGLQKHFTKYSLMEFLVLPSTYSQRVFEVLRSWDDKPEVTISLVDLHEMVGTPPSLRKKYPDFRRKVLEKAHKDINRHTALAYEWEAVKNGRSVAGIRFLFAQKRAGRVVAKKQAKVVQDSSDAKNKAFIAATKCHAASKGRCTPKDNLQCQVCAQLVCSTPPLRL